MSATKRLKQYLDFKGISKYEFHKKNSLSNGFLDTDRAIGTDKCAKILEQYSDISPEWLLTGKGSMLREEGNMPFHEPKNWIIYNNPSKYNTGLYTNLHIYYSSKKHTTNALYSVGLRLDEIIDIVQIGSYAVFEKKTGISHFDLMEIVGGRTPANEDLLNKILEAYQEINPAFLFENKGAPTLITATKNQQGIPLLSIEAMAGYGLGETQVLDLDAERFVIPTFKGVDFLIQVKGPSMYPKYNSGDIVACKKLPLSDLFFQWNKVYVLDTVHGSFIKRIKKGDDDNHVSLVSENPNYDTFSLHKSDIHAIAIVLGVIQLE